MSARTVHPFPARMAPEIAIDHLAAQTATGKLQVLDPMCGSGTVLAAALNHSHRAVGFDMDPLAVLISRVTTSGMNGSEIADAGDRIAALTTHDDCSPPEWFDDETQKFAEYWFGPDQRSDLARLSHRISNVESRQLREALQIALSRIIVTKSPKASLAADTSHSRPHKVQDSSTYDAIDGFRKSTQELGRLLNANTLVGDVSINRGDARSMPLADASIDFVVTSPPYLNAIDYLRGHRLSLIWLGYSIPYLRNIRSNSIGAERALQEAPKESVISMISEIEKRVSDPQLLPTATITRYAQDLTVFSKELYRVTKPGSKVITVIGNSTLRGNYIENDHLVRVAYEEAGFVYQNKIERELPENSRYMPAGSRSSAGQLSKRMRSEIVLEMRK